MAIRGAVPVATAVAVAAGAGAAQLGLGYGLGIVAWNPPAGSNAGAAWTNSLSWAVWIAATATVTGAVAGNRVIRSAAPSGPAARPPAPADPAAGAPDPGTPADPAPTRPVHPPAAEAAAPVGMLGRLVLALAGALGALVTVALVAVPAREAVRPDTFAPATIAAGHVLLGIVLGLLMALWALTNRPIAGNVLATGGWLWLLAVLAVTDALAAGRGPETAQLGGVRLAGQDTRFWFGDLHWPSAALTLGAALVIGICAALPAARRGVDRVAVAISGAAGPLLIAAAYQIPAPRLAGLGPIQTSAYLTAPYAVLAGLLGSVLVAATVRRSRPTFDPDPVPVGGTGPRGRAARDGAGEAGSGGGAPTEPSAATEGPDAAQALGTGDRSDPDRAPAGRGDDRNAAAGAIHASARDPITAGAHGPETAGRRPAGRARGRATVAPPAIP